MGLIRLIIFGLVIWMLWRLIKNFLARQNSNNRTSDKKLVKGNMVACHYCTVHVPENAAVEHNQLWFCSEGHKEKYLEDKQ